METKTEKAGNLTDDDYHRFLDGLITSVASKPGPWFTTDAQGLWETYLGSFEGEARQHHNCNACRHFITRFGGLVSINTDGVQEPVIWSIEWKFPDLSLLVAFNHLHDLVAKAKVIGVFRHKETTLGTPVTGVWRHMSCTNPYPWISAVQSAHEAAAEKRQDFAQVSKALAEFPLEVLEQAVALLESDTTYRADRVIGPVKWLRDLATIPTTPVKRNKIWRAIANAPAGFCHPRSAVTGSLIEDLLACRTVADTLARFNAKMAPTTYQRATAAPKAGAVQRAEKLFADLGLAPALARRYATLADVAPAGVLWQPQSAPQGKPSSLFGHLGATPATVGPLTLPTVTMTWAKFQRDVLPSALSIEVRVPQSADRFAALVTAADPTAPQILQWDNPVSWYYASGVDAEMRRRVESAGGQFTDVEVRATLLWNNYNDLDLHVHGPDGYVWFGAKRPTGCRGWLDVDANAGGANTRTPVENIRWLKGHAPAGVYRVCVRHYATHDRISLTPFVVELEIAGEILRFEGTTKRAAHLEDIDIAEFIYTPGQRVQKRRGTPAMVSPSNWNMVPDAFVPVRALIKSPNLWGEKPLPHLGQHIFALLEGCQDMQKGVGRGFFTEHTRSELREVRSVLEAYNATAEIASVMAPACGMGFSDEAPWDLVVRVHTPTAVGHYTIDRWE